MNHIQFLLFLAFALSVLINGVAVFKFLGINDSLSKNKAVFIGETCLLGSMVIVGCLLLLSISGLYKLPFLWLPVILNFLFLLNGEVRKSLSSLILQNSRPSIPVLIFIALSLFFLFRNIYFLVDVDSHAVYLYTQKLWLSHGHSLFASKALDAQVFVPHFDVVPYALGLVFFPGETLFPQLINFFFRYIVLLLIFGYTSYRFNSTYGLAGVFFVLLNGHFFFSGCNQWVLINGAVIAFLFAGVYNLWESRREDSAARLVLSLCFIMQLMANKYQMAYAFLLLIAMAFLIQYNPIKKFKQVLKDRKGLLVLMISCVCMLLWYVKNQLATGLAIFPIYAGKFHILGWTPERDYAVLHVFRGLNFNEIFKYLSYLFIWPGINASKIAGLGISLLPIIMIVTMIKGKLDRDQLIELCFWLSVSIVILASLCSASHQDPRYYRYPIGIFAFTSVFFIQYVLKQTIGLKNNTIVAMIVLLTSLPGYNILLHPGGGSFRRPTFAENKKVLLNQIHLKDVLEKHYPQNITADLALKGNPGKLESGAWFILNNPYTPSAFLLPIRPQVGLWTTTVIGWDSYESKDKIINDLKTAGIKWVMRMNDKQLTFLSQEEFAEQALQFDRYPDKIFYPYDMPPELVRTNF